MNRRFAGVAVVALVLSLAPAVSASADPLSLPVVESQVKSVAQQDNGLWEVVYAVDVVTLNEEDTIGYRLDDALAFGPGITVLSADITDWPEGVTIQSWSGDGPVTLSALLPPLGTHHYELTVFADAHLVPGTAAATCQTGAAGGFANVATISVVGEAPQSTEACAPPVAPVLQTAAGTPARLSDGTWSVPFLIDVHPAASTPIGGLAYTLDARFEVPEGVTVLGVTVNGPPYAPLDPEFDGSTHTAFFVGADRVEQDGRVFRVVLHAEVGVGVEAFFICPPAGRGGYASQVQLFAGTSSSQLSSSTACADVVTASLEDPPRKVLPATGLALAPVLPAGALLVVALGFVLVRLRGRSIG